MANPFTHVLHDIVRDPRWAGGSLEDALQALAEAASRALRSDRVSFWDLHDDGIRCEHLFDVSTGIVETGAFLAFADCPEYFEAISGARVVAVDDAPNDPRTRGLAEGYLVPLNIGAMLDAPILIGGAMAGVVCHESRGAPRSWTEPEKSFAASIGDLVALARQSARLRATEERLRRREREVRIALRAAAVGDWAWDMREDSVRWSADVGPLFGKPEGWQPPDLDTYMALIHPEDRPLLGEALEDAILAGGDYFVEHRVCWDDGTVHWLQCRGQVLFEDGQPIRVTGIAADHTERRELERRLQRSDRLESLGRLAGGVAHDFNNLLTAILGSSELLRLELTHQSQHQRLDTLESAASRAANLTRQLLAFSRRLPTRPRVIDLSATVRESASLIERLLGEDIALDIQVDEVLWVRADATQIEQVVMNLAVNARDAMPDGGRLSIRTAAATLDHEPSAALFVEDTGAGIPASVLRHIFDPFFTTKDEHQGTGLGLAMCHGIVEEYGGTIDVESEVGRGSTFCVLLPLDQAPQPSVPPGSQAEPAAGGAARNVLLIEDDRMVATLLLEVLRQEGHQVTHLTNGHAAIAWLEHHRPQAVITDVVLEGARGTEVASVARRYAPHLPVLMITGYAPDELPDALDDVEVLHKPFRMNDVRAWLGRLPE
ncbi:MAG: response regulator [Deltaproteobacteria bacterium]|nr:MAG: response regulator [Deltaproteobacteria bacterium]